MGFFDDVGNFFGNITGQTQRNQAMQAQQAAQQTAANAAGTLGGIATQDPNAIAQQAIASGQQAGEQIGRENATVGTQQALQAARTAGVNKGQAALVGGQQAGNLFTQGRQQGQGLGTGAYQTARGQNIGAATGQAQAAGVQGGIGGQQGAAGAAQQGSFLSGLGGLATAGLGLLSDEEAKKEIKDSSTLDEAAEKIPPKDFKYKDGGGERTGVLAQDVEKVNPENIVDTPAGKVIDVAKQTGTNTARLSEAARRIQQLERMIGGRRA